MTPYREPGKPFEEKPREKSLPAICMCGHLVDDHWFFNSDMGDCGALGYYDKSPLHKFVHVEEYDRQRGYVKHQREGICRCANKRGQIHIWHPPLLLDEDVANIEPWQKAP